MNAFTEFFNQLIEALNYAFFVILSILGVLGL